MCIPPLQHANVGWFEINQPLYRDDTAKVADPEEKLFILVRKFSRVCERRKLRVIVGQSKGIGCSRSLNVNSLNVRLKHERFEVVDCFQSPGSQVATDVRCERMRYT